MLVVTKQISRPDIYTMSNWWKQPLQGDIIGGYRPSKDPVGQRHTLLCERVQEHGYRAVMAQLAKLGVFQKRNPHVYQVIEGNKAFLKTLREPASRSKKQQAVGAEQEVQTRKADATSKPAGSKASKVEPARTRKAPAEHAANHAYEHKEGLDGLMWESRPNSKGTFRWARVRVEKPTAAKPVTTSRHVASRPTGGKANKAARTRKPNVNSKPIGSKANKVEPARTRKAPAERAADHAYEHKEGLDGLMWESRPTSNGTFRWMRVTQVGPERVSASRKQAGPGPKKPLHAKTIPQPMLAHQYRADLVKFPAVVQPKLDGVRCLANPTSLISRTGKSDFTHLTGVLSEVRSLLKGHPGLVLDGELYVHGLKFDQLLSMVKQGSPLVQYHVFDMADVGMPFKGRYALLEEMFRSHKELKHVKLVPGKMARDQKAIDAALVEYVDKHTYEGVMVRDPTAHYIPTRTTALLKYKRFIDDEFRITGCEETKAGRANLHLVTRTGVPFTAVVTGSQSMAADLLRRCKSLTGKMATVRYQELTGSRGVPRFPRVVAVDRWSIE